MHGQRNIKYSVELSESRMRCYQMSLTVMKQDTTDQMT